MVGDHFQGADPGMVWLELFGIALAGGITALALLGIEVKLIKMTSTLTLEVISKVRLYALRGILRSMQELGFCIPIQRYEILLSVILKVILTYFPPPGSKVKDMIQIGLSVAIYHDVLSPLNLVGIGVLLSSVLTYVEEETRGREPPTLCIVRVVFAVCCVGTRYAEEREREREKERAR